VELDTELARWQGEWRAHEVIPPSLARRVERDTRRMRWGVAGEIAVTVAMGGGSVGWAVTSRRPDVAILAAITAQALLFVPILGFDLVWLYFYRGETSVWTFLTRPAVVLIAWVGTAVAAAGALWYRRRLRRELENLLRLRRDLEGG
jgi:hypothetical protein